MKQMMEIIRSLKMSYGDAFFTSLTLQLHEIIASDYMFIACIDPQKMVSKTIAFTTNDGIQENFEYALQDTPCFDVSHNSSCIYPANVCDTYPSDQLLIDMNINGYVGTPLHDSKGCVVGLVVGLFERPIQDPEMVSDIFQFFAGRISAELERNNMVEELESLNAHLENTVEARTKELQEALNSLEATQKQMLEQEKQASLGRLVAGVAHEINTPLSVAILANSTLENIVESLSSSLNSEGLTKGKLKHYCEEMVEASSLIKYNLSRSAELVVNFKLISSEQTNDEITTINLNQWMPALITSLSPLARKNAIKLDVQISPDSYEISTYPAKLYQVINNIVTNAIHHAFYNFESEQQNSCTLKYCYGENDTVRICIRDNGSGIDASTLERIYEPFFTTRRDNGGTGLGMSIVYNLINGPLKGNVSIKSVEGSGTEVTLELPLKLKYSNDIV
jgi:two-component system NtrC family sensor kinase